MKRNHSLFLALSALLVMTAGCKKDLGPKTAVNLAKPATAGIASDPDWQMPSLYGRLIRFDIGDGNGSDCILAYDCSSNHVSLTEVNGSNSTTVFSDQTGFNLVGGGSVATNMYPGDISDQFAEFGGCHVISFDANKTGRQEHVLVYYPYRGLWWLLSYAGNGLWNNEGSGTSGIGGYDLKGLTDKIVGYDYGDGYRDALICYRPGNQFFWVLKNLNAGHTSSTTQASWQAVVKSNGGVGGYDLKGTYDQIVPVDNGAGTMSIVCYRPGYGYVFWENHNANSTSWSTVYSTRSGFENFPVSHQQDRMVGIDASGYLYGSEDMGLWYSAGSLAYANDWIYYWEESFVDGNWQINTPTWPFQYNPYGGGTGAGDHVLVMSGGSDENDALLFYAPGSAAQSQLWEGKGQFYDQVY